MANKPFRASFSEDIFNFKYRHEGAEDWATLARTLADDVCRDYVPKDVKDAIFEIIRDMKFIPGGRYLYYAGRPIKAFQNCYAFISEEDSREDWAELSWKSEAALMTGGGIGNDYSVYRPRGSKLSRTGGVASGPVSKMRMINEIGREVIQGGSRRAAIYASLSWLHPDSHELLVAKNWHDMKVPGTSITLAEAKAADFNFPCPLDMTNVSLNYDNKFLDYIMRDEGLPTTFVENVRQAMKTGEPGFSFNFGLKEKETGRNAPVSGDTVVITDEGPRRVFDLVDKESRVWTGKQWAFTTFKKTKSNVQTLSIGMSNGRIIKADPEHEFFVVEINGVLKVRADGLKVGDNLLVSLPFGMETPFKETRVKVSSVSPGPVEDVFCCDVGVEEHSFMAEGVIISNCTEFTTVDDSDVCNLGSVNVSRIDTIEELRRVTYLAGIFLLLGSVVADVPFEKVRKVREKNRRIGLGLMGIHEWLLRRGYRYEVTDELHDWLAVWRDASEEGAKEYAKKLGISTPTAFRAIAPTGTIGNLAGTTTGIEPIFTVAYKRRYLKNGTEWHYQYVIDAAAQAIIDETGVRPESIETSADLAFDYERRIKFQADVQDYVDMAISSTINLPAWGTEHNNESLVLDFAKTLAKYAPRLRGFTAYPDGSRGGQPLVPVSYYEAHNQVGVEYLEHDNCKSGVCGI